MNNPTDDDVLTPLRREITTARLCAMLGLSDRRVRQLLVEGVLERKANGSFCQVEAVQSYISFLRGDDDDTRLTRLVRSEVARVLAGRGDR
jgi:hypothetical protein